MTLKCHNTLWYANCAGGLLWLNGKSQGISDAIIGYSVRNFM